MKKIYKYIITPESKIMMPKGAEILTIQRQFDDICIWAIVDPDVELEERNLIVIGTGEKLNPEYEHNYISTIQQGGGMFIWHIFEVVKN